MAEMKNHSEPQRIGQVASTAGKPTTGRTRKSLRLSERPVPYLVDAIPHDRALVPSSLWQELMDAAWGRSDWPILLAGGVGVGKTCAALCLLDYVFAPRKYVAAPDLAHEVTWIRRSETPGREKVFWQDWAHKALVVLDELGTRDNVSDAHYEIVKKAIDQRLNKPAIFISNLPPNALSDVYDKRIVSRLCAGTVLDLSDWSDRRLEKR